MSKRLVRLSFIAIILTLVVLTATPVFAAVPALQEYLNTGGDGDSGTIYGANWAAMQFTSNSMSHSVTTVRVPVKRVGTTPGTATLSIRKAVGGLPSGTDLASATLNGDTITTSYGWWEFDVDDVTLDSASQYAIIIRALGGDVTNHILWQKDTGGGLANAVASSSANSGVSWDTASPADNLFEVYGYDAISIESVAVFSGFKETGDLLFVASYKNTFRPYYPLGDPSANFDFILYGTDGTTVKASQPVPAWGYKPQGIYLSAGSASGITLGSAMYLAVAIGSTKDSQALTSSDWKGTDLARLDAWIRVAAANMEDYYGVTLLKNISGVGEVLNDEGGVIFSNGIPGLMQYRPEIFQTVTWQSSADTDIPADSFSASKDWETSVGADLVALAESGGDLIGMDGRGIAQIVLIGLFSLLALFLLGKGQFTFAAVAAMPIALLGMDLGILKAAWVGLVCAILALVFVWNVWWSRT